MPLKGGSSNRLQKRFRGVTENGGCITQKTQKQTRIIKKGGRRYIKEWSTEGRRVKKFETNGYWFKGGKGRKTSSSLGTFGASKVDKCRGNGMVRNTPRLATSQEGKAEKRRASIDRRQVGGRLRYQGRCLRSKFLHLCAKAKMGRSATPQHKKRGTKSDGTKSGGPEGGGGFT